MRSFVSLLLALIIALTTILQQPNHAHAMCVASPFPGTWLNENRQASNRQFLEIQFLCLDTIDSSVGGDGQPQTRPASYYIQLHADCTPDSWCSEGLRAARSPSLDMLKSITSYPTVQIIHEIHLLAKDHLMLRQFIDIVDNTNQPDREYIEYYQFLSPSAIDRIPERGPYPTRPLDQVRPKVYVHLPLIDCTRFPCPYFITEKTEIDPQFTITPEATNSPPAAKPQSLAEDLVAEADRAQVLQLNKTAALQSRIMQDSLIPTSAEVTVSYEGASFTLQRAEALSSQLVRIYYAQNDDWGNIQFIDRTKPDKSPREALLVEVGEKEQVLQLNANAALQQQIFAAQFVPTSPEFTVDRAGIQYVGQRAENLRTDEVRVYYTQPPMWSVTYISKAGG